MEGVLLGLQLLLAAIFATAAVGKLLDLPGSRQALADFGLPQRVAAPAGVALPLVELAIAAGFVVEPVARWAGVAALLVLLAFIAGIATALRRGAAPDCHCFGQIHSAPAGRETLVRNGALAAAAAAVAIGGPGEPIDGWIGARSGAELAAVVFSAAALALAGLALALWRSNKAMRADLEEVSAELASLPAGLPIGLPAPDFTLPDINGASRSLEALCAQGRNVALLFATPDCPGCRQLLPDIGRWQATLGDRLTIVVISMGVAATNRSAFTEHGITDVLLQSGVEVMSDYRVRATPSAVLVGPDGRIASAPAAGAPTIESLVRLSLRNNGSGLALGETALTQAQLSEAS